MGRATEVGACRSRATRKGFGPALIGCWLAAAALLLVYGVAQAASPIPVLAQSFDFLRARGTGGGQPGLFDFGGWPVKAALVFLAFLAAMLFVFLVVFPALLRKSRPWWPLSAYGLCMAIVLTVTFGVGLALFWNRLVIDATGPKLWLNVLGLRCLVIVAWLFVVCIVLAVFRSPHARTPAVEKPKS